MIIWISVLYFVGLVVFSIAVASFTEIDEVGFMIIGGGTILYAVVYSLAHYLRTR